MADARLDVLVALLPEPRDLELARDRAWYRVRSRQLLERVRGGPRQFTDLAFYQPDSFGPERRCVRYHAPILGISHARRMDLMPEEPNHPRADQWYVRFDLGPIEELPRPVPSARGRRILFIATNWQRIASADDINDLFLGTPIEEAIYRRLRSAGMLPEREYHVEVADPARPRRRRHYFLDLAVFCQQRDLDIECDGDTWHTGPEKIPADIERHNLLEANRWHVMHFTTTQLMQRLDDTVSVVREAVNSYGGIVQPDLVVRRFDSQGHLGPGQATLDLSR
jgi:hypothetical protein